VEQEGRNLFQQVNFSRGGILLLIVRQKDRHSKNISGARGFEFYR